ncbi:VRR-NUC domain-containing protein [Larkinella insperata]|uniref:VRR-NUC domain-containing protein n=1 Tax=Larkinella insperata TaxID=332158 RepID=A0ABW3QM41_9BACT|nr:VRR-NUC domain-containing protein [Larkinella insperata]
MKAAYVPKTKFSDKTANDLTQAAIRSIQLLFEDSFATRLSSTGTYRQDVGRFVPSQQRKGLPDIFGVVEGLAVFIEIKMPGDRLSADQVQTITELRAAGAWVLIASNYEDVYNSLTVDFREHIFNHYALGRTLPES